MKKSLLALAVFGAFAGAASAQSNVTVYGVVDIGLTSLRSDSTSTRIGLDSGIQSGSRLGFKGKEDLGGGLSAEFQLENGFNADTGSLGQGGRIFGRQAFVGLSGGFGSVKFGRQYMPIFNAVDSIDPFGTGMAGDASIFLGGNIFNNIDVRTSNAIDYSISASGFTGELLYGLGEVAGNTSANRQLGFSLGYANGPINVALAYHNVNDATGNGSAKATFLGGTYNFGPATGHLAFDTEKTDNGSATLLDARNWLAGVTLPVGGAGSLFADYIRHDDRTAANVDMNQVAIGYTHSLSKRTNIHTSYSRVNVNGISVLELGLRHKF